MGADYVKTPNMDHASSGTLFKNGYVDNHTLVTGMLPIKYNVEQMILDKAIVEEYQKKNLGTML